MASYIDRSSDEFLFRPIPPKLQPAPTYPWQEATSTSLPKITKEYFRCHGNELNPMRVVTQKEGAPRYLHDCGGSSRHSLPLRNGEEFIYPILIDLLNHVQQLTGKRVVITSGHRCPAHNSYVDESTANTTSKHMVGAAVTFYVQDLEGKPELIVDHLLDYFRDQAGYRGLKEYQIFQRDKSTSQPSTIPAWLNKEVAIRIFPKNEGRNFDNRHPYPYISLTVRHDRASGQPVSYSWSQADKNYLRW